MNIKLFSAVAVRAEILALLAKLDTVGQRAVETIFDLNPAVALRILNGEAFHVGIANPWHVSELIEHGKALAKSHVPFGRVPLAIGIHENEAGTVSRTIEQIQELLLGGQTVAYTGDGTSGKTFLGVIERLGIAGKMEGKLAAMGAGEPVRAVANRQIQFCAAPLTTIVAADGVSPIAVLPDELSANIDMSIFLSPSAEYNSNANALLAFLVSSERDAFLESRGVTRFEFV